MSITDGRQVILEKNLIPQSEKVGQQLLRELVQVQASQLYGRQSQVNASYGALLVQKDSRSCWLGHLLWVIFFTKFLLVLFVALPVLDQFLWPCVPQSQVLLVGEGQLLWSSVFLGEGDSSPSFCTFPFFSLNEMMRNLLSVREKKGLEALHQNTVIAMLPKGPSTKDYNRVGALLRLLINPS